MRTGTRDMARTTKEIVTAAGRAYLRMKGTCIAYRLREITVMEAAEDYMAMKALLETSGYKLEVQGTGLIAKATPSAKFLMSSNQTSELNFKYRLVP